MEQQPPQPQHSPTGNSRFSFSRSGSTGSVHAISCSSAPNTGDYTLPTRLHWWLHTANTPTLWSMYCQHIDTVRWHTANTSTFGWLHAANIETLWSITCRSPTHLLVWQHPSHNNTPTQGDDTHQTPTHVYYVMRFMSVTHPFASNTPTIALLNEPQRAVC